MDKPKQQPKPRPKPRPQTIQHVKIKDALNDKAFLTWINNKYPSR
jgi:hypothetical protein